MGGFKRAYLWGVEMKYEIMKGNEKDFEGATDEALFVLQLFSTIDYSVDMKATIDGQSLTPHDFQYIIAERRPITEPVWSGEGLPPVGTKCEVQTSSNSPWFECEIVYSGESGAAFISTKGNSIGCVDDSCTDFFRPIRSPEDVARDEAIKAMREALGHAAGLIEVRNIYRAIAAGKIPGVKLE